MASPSPRSPQPAATPTPPSRIFRLRPRTWLIIGGGVIAILILLAVTIYGGFLGARLAPGLSFQILEPDTVSPGHTTIVRWDISTQAAAQYPAEKIELCRSRFFAPDCVTLTASTQNDGEAAVTIPANTPAGTGYLRLTARDTQGRLRTNLSSVKTITVGSGSTTIGPSSTRGQVVSTLQPTGPRSPVGRNSRHRVLLPNPGTSKKIELCRRGTIGDTCRTLAASVNGSNAAITIPRNATPGRAYLKVSERGATGQLTGKIEYTRALFVTDAPPVSSQTAAGDGGGSGDSGGGGGSGDGGSGSGGGDSGGDESSGDSNDGGTESTFEPEEDNLEETLNELAAVTDNPELEELLDPPQTTPAAPPAPPATTIYLQFLSPASDTQITAGTPLDVKVKLGEETRNRITCQQWTLDDQPIAVDDWLGGQAPDLSAEPCTP